MKRAPTCKLGFPWLLRAMHIHVNITLVCGFITLILLLKSIGTALRLIPSETTQIDPSHLSSSSLSSDIRHSFDDLIHDDGDDYEHFHGRFLPSPYALLQQPHDEKTKYKKNNNDQMIDSDLGQSEDALFFDKPNVHLASQQARGSGRNSATATPSPSIHKEKVSEQMPAALITDVKRPETEHDKPRGNSPSSKVQSNDASNLQDPKMDHDLFSLQKDDFDEKASLAIRNKAEKHFPRAKDHDQHKKSPEQTATSILMSLGKGSAKHNQDNETQMESHIIISKVSKSGDDKQPPTISEEPKAGENKLQTDTDMYASQKRSHAIITDDASNMHKLDSTSKEASAILISSSVAETTYDRQASSQKNSKFIRLGTGGNMDNQDPTTQITSGTLVLSVSETSETDDSIPSSQNNSMSFTGDAVSSIHKEDSTTQIAHDIIIPSAADTGNEKQLSVQLGTDTSISLSQKYSQSVRPNNYASSTHNQQPTKHIAVAKDGDENEESATRMASAINIPPVAEAGNEKQDSRNQLSPDITISPVAKDGYENHEFTTKMAFDIPISPVAEAGNEEQDSPSQMVSDIITPSVAKAGDEKLLSITQMASDTITSFLSDDKEILSRMETDPKTFSYEKNMHPFTTDAGTYSASIDHQPSADTPTKPYTLGPKITNWDQQRRSWLSKNYPDSDTSKPRVLLITGSPSKPCDNPEGAHYLLKSIKNKIDYCRLHGIQIFYNMVIHFEEMSGFWLKLPLIRQMMLAHPEVEWLWWMDSDAMFTDMSFEIPFEKYGEYDMVVPGYEEQVYVEKSWCGLNAGSFLMRNSQWSLDMLDAWAHMGPKGKVREDAGKLLGQFLTNRGDYEADDQSALIYLLVTQRDIWGKRVFLENSYCLHGYWVSLVDKFQDDTPMIMSSSGLLSGNNYQQRDWPFVTHFVGCKPCGGDGSYPSDRCMLHMERSFNFADNQILQTYGFQHQRLNSSQVVHSTMVS